MKGNVLYLESVLKHLVFRSVVLFLNVLKSNCAMNTGHMTPTERQGYFFLLCFFID